MRIPTLSPNAGPFAQEVHRRMVALGVTQKALALRAGLNETYVRDLLTGRSKNPRGQEMTKLAAALGCEITDLTNPRGAGVLPDGEKFAKDEDEFALLQLWRSLSRAGRERFINAGFAAVPKPTGRSERG